MHLTEPTDVEQATSNIFVYFDLHLLRRRGNGCGLKREEKSHHSYRTMHDRKEREARASRDTYSSLDGKHRSGTTPTCRPGKNKTCGHKHQVQAKAAQRGRVHARNTTLDRQTYGQRHGEVNGKGKHPYGSDNCVNS